MARDHPPVSATSVSVDRLCNIERDIYYYHHDNLKPESIQQLVMMQTHIRKEMIEEDKENDEEASAKPDGAYTQQDLDWAWHTINE